MVWEAHVQCMNMGHDDSETGCSFSIASGSHQNWPSFKQNAQSDVAHDRAAMLDYVSSISTKLLTKYPCLPSLMHSMALKAMTA